jgi:hypothetical protein
MALRYVLAIAALGTPTLAVLVDCSSSDGTTVKVDAGDASKPTPTATTAPTTTPDAGPSDAATKADAGAGDAGPAPICSAPVGFIGNVSGRDLYMAYTDVDTVPNQTCPIHTSTNYMGNVVFAFYSGSPGYTIDGRQDYIILSASPATLNNVGLTSSANALENQTISITFQRRVYPDQLDAGDGGDAGDAGAPPVWKMTFRMISDPDPAKWTVALYSFGQ